MVDDARDDINATCRTATTKDQSKTSSANHPSIETSEKKVIYCVVNRNEIARLQSLVHEIDPIAFLVSQDVHDVLGEGFTF